MAIIGIYPIFRQIHLIHWLKVEFPASSASPTWLCSGLDRLQGLWGLPPSQRTCKRLRCYCPGKILILGWWNQHVDDIYIYTLYIYIYTYIYYTYTIYDDVPICSVVKSRRRMLNSPVVLDSPTRNCGVVFSAYLISGVPNFDSSLHIQKDSFKKTQWPLHHTFLVDSVLQMLHAQSVVASQEFK